MQYSQIKPNENLHIQYIRIKTILHKITDNVSVSSNLDSFCDGRQVAV